MQLLFAAKYMAPGGKKLDALLGALPLYEEAAGAMRLLRRAAMKREAEVLEPASARATCAAEAMRAALAHGSHNFFDAVTTSGDKAKSAAIGGAPNLISGAIY